MDDLLSRGAELFDRGDYFAAHEVWEDGWRQSTGPLRALYQGLVQTAAAWLKANQGSRKGALKLSQRALQTLHPLGEREHGVDVARVRTALTNLITAIESDATELPPPPTIW